MIIKITVDDGISNSNAAMMADMLIDFYESGKQIKELSGDGMVAKITHKSKAGNIFIHVSKVEYCV